MPSFCGLPAIDTSSLRLHEPKMSYDAGGEIAVVGLQAVQHIMMCNACAQSPSCSSKQK